MPGTWCIQRDILPASINLGWPGYKIAAAHRHSPLEQLQHHSALLWLRYPAVYMAISWGPQRANQHPHTSKTRGFKGILLAFAKVHLLYASCEFKFVQCLKCILLPGTRLSTTNESSLGAQYCHVQQYVRCLLLQWRNRASGGSARSCIFVHKVGDYALQKWHYIIILNKSVIQHWNSLFPKMLAIKTSGIHY